MSPNSRKVMKRALAVAVVLAIVLGWVVHSSRSKKPNSPSDTVAGAPVSESAEGAIEALKPPSGRGTSEAQRSVSPNAATNSGQEQEVVVSPAWGFQPMKYPAAALKQWRKEQEVRLSETIAKDMADGINSEAREKQARLRSLCSSLKRGQTLSEVMAILGTPDVLQTLSTENDAVVVRQVAMAELLSQRTRTVASYWPRVGVPFDGRNGQGYEVLWVVMDDAHLVESWLWQQPSPAYAGSIGTVSVQREYWEGKHAKSGSPPQGTF